MSCSYVNNYLGISPRTLFVEMYFGSKLYGLETPNSDTDIQSISIQPYILNGDGREVQKLVYQTKKSAELKNSADDIDIDLYTLSSFFLSLLRSDLRAVDMLHAPDDMLLVTSDTWEELRKHRSKLYTSNITSYIGYARGQLDSYGLKGSKVEELWTLQNLLNSVPPRTKMAEIWDELPVGQHLSKPTELKRGCRVYNVANKLILDSTRVQHALEIVNRVEKMLGPRARAAAQNNGVDWKAVSHAFRALLQAKLILTTGELTFPLPQADHLREVKAGNFGFKDVIEPLILDVFDEVRELAEKSTLPDAIDMEFWIGKFAEIQELSFSDAYHILKTTKSSKRQAKLR